MTLDKQQSAGGAGEDYFQQLADGAPVMIWMSGLDLGCYYFNQAWLDFRGRTLEQESGNGWAEGVHPDDLQRCVNHYIACFERRVAFAMSYRLQHRSGQYRWILDRGAPHYLPDGSFLGYFGGCSDIENDSPIARHAELGSALAKMREFARQVAQGAMQRNPGLSHATGVPLETLAMRIAETHAAQQERLRFAADEMHRLASDMITYGSIERGACLP